MAILDFADSRVFQAVRRYRRLESAHGTARLVLDSSSCSYEKHRQWKKEIEKKYDDNSGHKECSLSLA